jgi:hypothetical protein
MGAKNDRIACRYFVQFFYKYGAFALEFVHDKFVMHDFMAYIDRCAKLFQGLFHNNNCAINTSAKAARVGE